MEYKIVKSPEDLIECRELVLGAYQKKRLVKLEEDLKLFEYYDGNDFTTIYGHINETKKMTLSALYDFGDTTLPLDKYYRKELQRLRKSDPKICELGLFSDNRAVSSFKSMINLIALLVNFSYLKGFKQIVFGVHPYSVKFYKKYFNGVILGSATAYEDLNGAPVALIYISLYKKDLEKFPSAIKRVIQFGLQKTIQKNDFRVA
jgi:hypothetical protein